MIMKGAYAGRRPNHRLTTPTPSRRHSNASSTNDKIHVINSFLSAYSYPVSFNTKPLPCTKDITNALNFLLTRLEYPPSVTKMEDDLFVLLKYFKYPSKTTKSALKTLGTPRLFPVVLDLLHWLVWMVMYGERLLEFDHMQMFFGDCMVSYVLITYIYFIKGEDRAVECEDERFIDKLRKEIDLLAGDVKQRLEKVGELEGKVEGLKCGQESLRGLEDKKKMMEMNVEKYNEVIESLKIRLVKMGSEMEGKERELSEKMVERNRICDENVGLKRVVEEQGIDLRDVERMERELQSVERDIEESEIERNKWEDKCWDLDAVTATKLKELQAVQIECNQDIRRLKLGHDIQYQLNAKGLTPAEVLGMDYKSTLKPILRSSSDEVKRTSIENLESLMSLQKLSRDIAAKIDTKRNLIAILESRIDEVETQLNSIKNETLDCTSRCATEARHLVENFEIESHNVDVVEKEARELVESSEAKLQQTVTECQKEVQMCARELLTLIDSVSKFKEFTLSKVLEIKNDVSKTTDTITQIYTSNPPV